MSSEGNKTVVLRFLDEAYNKQNLAVGDELLATDFVAHSPDGDMEGIQAWKQFATNVFLAAFPDLRCTVADTVAEGDKVVARWEVQGTHRGNLGAIAPTGKKVEITGIAIYRLAGGKIVEAWAENDRLGLMRQVGAIPTPG